MTDKALTFFRVFDIAFFAPGVVLLATASWLGIDLPHAESSLTSPHGVLTLLLGIGGLYIAGLMTHAVVWWLVPRLLGGWQKQVEDRIGQELDGLKSRQEDEQTEEERLQESWPPMALEFSGTTRSEIILYFWNLRATCWNLSLALLLAAGLILSSLLGWLPSPSPLPCPAGLLLPFVMVMGSWLLLLQGNSFHLNYRKTLRFQREGFGAPPPSP